jgi:5-hydroxytryptamine receptor 2
MYANVSSDAVATAEDTTALVLIDENGLIHSAVQRHSHTISEISYYWPALLLSFFSIVGVIGNLLVCLAIATERRLQNRTNWFLFSLALADMLVSGLVIPLAVVKDFIGTEKKRISN